MVERTCAHCGGPMRGFARLNDDWLCHPDDEGMDCYHLVTVWCHATPCTTCLSPELTKEWLEYFKAVDAEVDAITPEDTEAHLARILAEANRQEQQEIGGGEE